MDVDTAVPIEDLADWVGTKRPDLFRSRVVAKLHAQRLVDFDKDSRTVSLSPTGSAAAETVIKRMRPPV